MKATIKELKGIIKEAVMAEDRFTRTVKRIMTGDEARERATEMGFSPEVVKFVGRDFDRMHDLYPPDELEDMAGDNGRLALGMSWEHALEELARVMGIQDLDDEQLRTVYDAFYEE